MRRAWLFLVDDERARRRRVGVRERVPVRGEVFGEGGSEEE